MREILFRGKHVRTGEWIKCKIETPEWEVENDSISGFYNCVCSDLTLGILGGRLR